MKSIESLISEGTKQALKALYNSSPEGLNIIIQRTRKEFEGDFTGYGFSVYTFDKRTPEQTAKDIGEYLKKEIAEIEDFNVIKGFLNLVISKSYWIDFLKRTNNKKLWHCKTCRGCQYYNGRIFAARIPISRLHLGHVGIT